MDTVSSLVSHRALGARPLATFVVLAFVALMLLVALGAALVVVPPPAPADPLLAPFRWNLRVPFV